MGGYLAIYEDVKTCVFGFNAGCMQGYLAVMCTFPTLSPPVFRPRPLCQRVYS